jgi:hypothetical protein
MANKSLVLYHPAYQHKDEKGQDFSPPREGYRVVSVKNSVDYVPGQFLPKAQVQELSDVLGYDVSVRGYKEGDPIR